MSSYSFLGDHVDTRKVRLLNGDILEIHLNPFNYNGDDELKEVSQIISDTLRTPENESSRAHRIHVFKNDTDKNEYDYCCLMTPPCIDHLIECEDEQIRLSIHTLCDMYDVIDYSPDVKKIYHRMVVNLSMTTMLVDVSEKISRLFVGYEMEWILPFLHAKMIGEMLDHPGFSTTVKFALNQPLDTKGIEVLGRVWSNLRELCLPFDPSMDLESTVWEQIVMSSCIDTLIVIYNLASPFSFRTFMITLRQWKDFSVAIHNRGQNPYIRVVVLNRIL